MKPQRKPGAAPLDDGGHVVSRIKHADYGLDGLHVRGEVFGLLPVDLDPAADIGMEAN